MTLECVLLTGGGSRRMGSDKGRLLVQGEPLSERIARMVAEVGVPVAALGPDPIPGHRHVPDAKPGEGPLAALAGYAPGADATFVASCDIPRFDARIVGVLLATLEGFDAAVPSVADRAQPLCGVYRAPCFEVAKNLAGCGERRISRWIERLNVRLVSSEELALAGLDPECCLGANTPEEFARLAGG